MSIVLLVEDGPFRYESYKEDENKHCYLGQPLSGCKDIGTVACNTCHEGPDKYRVVTGCDSWNRLSGWDSRKLTVSTFGDEWSAESLCESLNQTILEWAKAKILEGGENAR